VIQAMHRRRSERIGRVALVAVMPAVVASNRTTPAQRCRAGSVNPYRSLLVT